MLEISATIHHRPFELRDGPEAARAGALDTAIGAFERSFLLTNEPRCGINLAPYLRNCRASLKQGIKGESAQRKAEEEYSLRVIRAQAPCGLRRAAESHAAFEGARNMMPPPAPPVIDATNKRLHALHRLLQPETVR